MLLVGTPAKSFQRKKGQPAGQPAEPVCPFLFGFTMKPEKNRIELIRDCIRQQKRKLQYGWLLNRQLIERMYKPSFKTKGAKA